MPASLKIVLADLEEAAGGPLPAALRGAAARLVEEDRWRKLHEVGALYSRWAPFAADVGALAGRGTEFLLSAEGSAAELQVRNSEWLRRPAAELFHYVMDGLGIDNGTLSAIVYQESTDTLTFSALLPSRGPAQGAVEGPARPPPADGLPSLAAAWAYGPPGPLRVRFTFYGPGAPAQHWPKIQQEGKTDGA